MSTSVRSIARQFTPEIDADIESMVRTSRIARRLPKKSTEFNSEVQTLKQLLLSLFEHSAVINIETKFRKSVITYEKDPPKVECESDVDDTHFCGLFLEIPFHPETSGANSPQLSVHYIEREFKAVISNLLSSINSGERSIPTVTLEKVTASYDSTNCTFHVEILLKPPKKPVQVTGKKRSHTAIHTDVIQLPDGKECFDFYTNRPDTWSFFGKKIYTGQ